MYIFNFSFFFLNFDFFEKNEIFEFLEILNFSISSNIRIFLNFQFFWKSESSTSVPGGHLVDGLQPTPSMNQLDGEILFYEE